MVDIPTIYGDDGGMVLLSYPHYGVSEYHDMVFLFGRDRIS